MCGTCRLVSILVMIQCCNSAVEHRSPWGNAQGKANRVALEACVKARNEGRHIERESRDILMSAAQSIQSSQSARNLERN